jgi:hypothetical protein
MKSQVAADAMKHDGVDPETLLMFSEAYGRSIRRSVSGWSDERRRRSQIEATRHRRSRAPRRYRLSRRHVGQGAR